MIKTGDTVLWRGCFNTLLPVEAVIERIEICERPRSKYGKPVSWIPAEAKDYAVFSFTNGHWAYGEQVIPIDSPSDLQICDSQEVEEAFELY
jgi:hypothetical protein